MLRILAIAAMLLVVCSAPSMAEVTNFSVTLDGAQANAGAGTGSSATGTATASYDSDTGMFSWDLSWSGMTPTICHFHGPANPNQNAGVTVNIFAISGSSSPSAGSTVITGPEAADLLNELWYINIHSAEFPGGEIRGQVLVEGTVEAEGNSVSEMKARF